MTREPEHDDILDDLRELRDQREAAVYPRSDATDRSGMVRVSLARDGLPQAFWVSSQWRDRLAATAFARAVTQACQAARMTRAQQQSRALQRSVWQQRLERLTAEVDSRAVAERQPAPAAFRRPAAGGAAPALDELAEQVMRSLDQVTSPAGRTRLQSLRGDGAGGEGALVIRVWPGGQAACQAHAGWVDRQTGAELSWALNQAAAASRKDLAAKSARVLGGVQPHDLVREALAALDAVTRYGT